MIFFGPHPLLPLQRRGSEQHPIASLSLAMTVQKNLSTPVPGNHSPFIQPIPVSMDCFKANLFVRPQGAWITDRYFGDEKIKLWLVYFFMMLVKQLHHPLAPVSFGYTDLSNNIDA